MKIPIFIFLSALLAQVGFLKVDAQTAATTDLNALGLSGQEYTKAFEVWKKAYLEQHKKQIDAADNRLSLARDNYSRSVENRAAEIEKVESDLNLAKITAAEKQKDEIAALRHSLEYDADKSLRDFNLWLDAQGAKVVSLIATSVSSDMPYQMLADTHDPKLILQFVPESELGKTENPSYIRTAIIYRPTNLYFIHLNYNVNLYRDLWAQVQTIMGTVAEQYTQAIQSSNERRSKIAEALTNWQKSHPLPIAMSANSEKILNERDTATNELRAAQENVALYASKNLEVAFQEMKTKEQFLKTKGAAENGDAKAQSRLGDIYRTGEGVAKDMEVAIKWYEKAAEQGDRDSEFYLGLAFCNGEGVVKNYTAANNWFRKAAENGDVDALCNLGVMYDNGDGVPRDASIAADFFLKAAMLGSTIAQVNLGYKFANGEGITKNEIEGLAWTYIAAATGDQMSISNRAVMERDFGNDVMLQAQQRSREILAEIDARMRRNDSSIPNESATPSSPVDDAVKGSGSGAIVSSDGVVLTAAHVVAGSSRIRVSTVRGIVEARTLGIDTANDIAILKVDGGPYLALPVISSRGVRLGQSVSTIGFPETQIQGFSPKVTRGEINSLNGFRDDPRQWQVSVPVQKGNSGGPLLDETGNLIGIITGKLGIDASQEAGDLLENVNYAVKATYALPLLEQYLPQNASQPALKPMHFEDMVERAQQSAVLILTY